MGFPRPECWSGLPLPPPGDLPNPGIKPEYPALAGDSLPLSHLGSLILPPSIGAQQAFEKLSHAEKQRGSKNECTFHPEITLAPHAWLAHACGQCFLDWPVCNRRPST